MLRFIKKGIICDHHTLDLSWFKKNVMTPVTYLVNDKILRIFVGMCDEDNIGRVGYVDVNPDNPKEILDYSKTPVLDIGEAGCFDDHGVLPSCLIEEEQKLYMFYSGYQRHLKIPYTIFNGVAVSTDQGKTFVRTSRLPFLKPVEHELFFRAAIYCLKIHNTYKFWYSSGNIFIHNTIKTVPKYNIRYIELASIFSHTNSNQQSVICMDWRDDEYGLAMPRIFIENGIYKMVYSIRTISKGYRIGYAESNNEGATWIRKDDQIDFDVSSSGWDSEMVCFAHLQSTKNKRYMFYCGNHYGIGGVGCAELIRE